MQGKLKGVHHVAYRCRDAKETVNFYKEALGMHFQLAIAEDYVPSTGAYDPYMHVFLDAGNNNVLAFFELPEQKPMDRDRNTPEWVQHIAFRVDSVDSLIKNKKHLEDMGLDVLGPTDHGIFKSIYFFDPNGHRIELTADTATEDDIKRLNEVAQPMIDEWDKTKKAPQHANWLHQNINSKKE